MAGKPEETAAAVAQPAEVGCCAACNLFWFDAFASVRLTPRAVLELFRYVGEAGKASNTLGSAFSCPRCRSALAFTHDMQHTTRFTYWRCAVDHGQLITFTQFLAQKNFIRAPSPEELVRLRDTVREVTCSQCGAPIDLAKDSACPHCGAPIALIDSQGVAKALRDLSGAPFAHADAAQALSDAQIAALFDVERMRERDGDNDLLAIGAAAIAGLVGGWLASR